MNRHSAIDPRRFFNPHDAMGVELGCYVDGTQGTMRESTLKAIAVAYRLGAISPMQFEAWGTRLLNQRADEDLDYEFGLYAESALNEANIDPDYYWFWEEGDLFYGIQEE